MVEQGDDREPVGDRADHRRFRRRCDVVEPGKSGLEGSRCHVNRAGEHQQPGREELHALEFVHWRERKKKSGQDGCPDPILNRLEASLRPDWNRGY